MNQQQQRDVIDAHLAGKCVQVMPKDNSSLSHDWIPLVKGEYEFDFQNNYYRVMPRVVEAFLLMPIATLQDLLEGKQLTMTTCRISNKVGQADGWITYPVMLKEML